MDQARDDPLPGHVEELVKECSATKARRRWPAPEPFLDSSAPIPFEVSNRLIDNIKGDRSRREALEACPVAAWLEDFLSASARACAAEDLSRRKLQPFIRETQPRICAICDIAAGRLSHLMQQDNHGRSAAGMMHKCSDRARHQLTTSAEQRIAPLLRAEKLKADLRKAARPGRGSSWAPAGSRQKPSASGSSGEEQGGVDEARRKRDRDRRLRRKEFRKGFRKGGSSQTERGRDQEVDHGKLRQGSNFEKSRRQP